MQKVGFEPTPFRNRALIYRLRPLGHFYLSTQLHPANYSFPISISIVYLFSYYQFCYSWMGHSHKGQANSGQELPYEEFAHTRKKQSISSTEQANSGDTLEITPIHLSNIASNWTQEERKKLQRVVFQFKAAQEGPPIDQVTPEKGRMGSPVRERGGQRGLANNQNLAKRLEVLRGEIDRIRCLSKQRRVKILDNKKQNHQKMAHFHEQLFLSVLALEHQSSPKEYE